MLPLVLGYFPEVIIISQISQASSQNPYLFGLGLGVLLGLGVFV